MNRTMVRLLIAVAALNLCHCGDDAAKTEADFVFVSGSEHHFIDPQRISWRHDFRLIELLFEPLLRRDLNDFSLVPGVANRWQVSDDGLTYTFHLRDTARWSNGDRVKADDFIYAWRRPLLPDFSADYTQMLWCIQGAKAFFNWRTDQLAQFVAQPHEDPAQEAQRLYDQAIQHFAQTVGIRSMDNSLTLVVTLEQPTPYFLELVAFGTFMPNHAKSVKSFERINADTGLASLDTQWNKPDNLICNGPYTLVRRRFKRDLLVVANNHYWDAANVGCKSILEKIISDPQTALLAYERGEVHWLPDIPSASTLAADLVANDRSDVHVAHMAGTYFYNFNCNKTLSDGRTNPLSDPRVRKALSMGIDRKTIVDKVTRLKQPVARSFIPPRAVGGYEPPVEDGPVFDPDGARKLLAAAGYSQGEALSGLSILYNTGHGHENIAQQIKRTWEKELDVVVTLEAVESRVFGDRLKKKDYAIARAGWFGDYRDPSTFLQKNVSTDGNNDAAYDNPEYDTLVANASHELDLKRRYQIFRQAEARLLRDQPFANIFHYVNISLFDPLRVSGLTPNPWAFLRLDRVKVK